MSFKTFKLDECPNVPVSVVAQDHGEWLPLGLIKVRILEDGSKTGKLIPRLPRVVFFR